MRARWIAVLGLVAIAADPAMAREAKLLTPSSGWVVDYLDNRCRLRRQFGTGDDAVLMLMDQYGPGDSFNLTLVGPSLVAANGWAKPKLRFGPAEEEREVTVRQARTDKQLSIVIPEELRLAPLTEAERKLIKATFGTATSYRLEPIGAAREKAVTWLHLQNIVDDDLRLQLGPMEKPLAALRDCGWDTVQSWGLDPAAQKALTREASQIGSKPIFTDADYPKEGINRGTQTTVAVALLIDEKGVPTNCILQRSTGSNAFSERVCPALMARTRYTPALDAAGKPIRSFLTRTIVFQLQ